MLEDTNSLDGAHLNTDNTFLELPFFSLKEQALNSACLEKDFKWCSNNIYLTSLRCALNGQLRTQGFFLRRAMTDQTWADAQADPSLCWAHRSFYFVMLQLISAGGKILSESK